MDNHEPFVSPEVRDYGDLMELTKANELQGFEDAGPKFSVLDVSDGVFP